MDFNVNNSILYNVANQIINLMLHLHKAGNIAHLDFNPNNILIQYDKSNIYNYQKVYIIDFGLARSLADDKTITYSGMTPDYFTPEQI